MDTEIVFAFNAPPIVPKSTFMVLKLPCAEFTCVASVDNVADWIAEEVSLGANDSVLRANWKSLLNNIDAVERLAALKLDTLKFEVLIVVEFKVVIVESVANRLSVSIVPSTSNSFDTEALIASTREAFIVEPLNVSVSILLTSPLQSIVHGANTGP